MRPPAKPPKRSPVCPRGHLRDSDVCAACEQEDARGRRIHNLVVGCVAFTLVLVGLAFVTLGVHK